VSSRHRAQVTGVLAPACVIARFSIRVEQFVHQASRGANKRRDRLRREALGVEPARLGWIERVGTVSVLGRPLYSYAEAARPLDLPTATLRWRYELSRGALGIGAAGNAEDLEARPTPPAARQTGRACPGPPNV